MPPRPKPPASLAALREAMEGFEAVAQELAVALCQSEVRALDLEIILTTCLVTIATDTDLVMSTGPKLREALERLPRRRPGVLEANRASVDPTLVDSILTILGPTKAH